MVSMAVMMQGTIFLVLSPNLRNGMKISGKTKSN